MILSYEELLEKSKETVKDLMRYGLSFEDAVKEYLYMLSQICLTPIPVKKLVKDLEKWYYGLETEK